MTTISGSRFASPDSPTVGGGPHDDLAAKETTMTAGERRLALFEKLGQVGEGTYGYISQRYRHAGVNLCRKVYKARRTDSGKLVALKRIRMETEKEGFPITAMREVRLLQKLDHSNILKLDDIISARGSVYMVFDYMEYDLTGILNHPTFAYSPAQVKCIMLQILDGLHYLHDHSILHRDIKGSNILLNGAGIVKLADFGLARICQERVEKKTADYTNRVITLWYRPPELLLGSTHYGPEVDIWGVGCIMLELVMKKAAFQGRDEISQLDAVYRICGTPNESTWPTISALPWYHLIKPKSQYSSRFRKYFGKHFSEDALDVLERMLQLDPSKRISAKETMKDAYFCTAKPLPCQPAELPRPDGEWHEYETKQRKRAAAAAKEKETAPKDDKERAKRPKQQ